tara:strand:- start:3333 stop:4286 length:954 start_codon:yes stop_codon:yes gene_type:complete
MNIRKIIAEEFRQTLSENKEAGVQALKNLEAMPEEELQGILAKALPLLQKEFPKWAEQQGGMSEALEGEPGVLKKAGAAAAVHTPLGRDALALYMTAIDRATPIGLRVGTVMAVLNLISPIDIGSLFGMDLFGPLAVMDDMMFLQLMKWRLGKAQLPAKRIYDRISQLAGEKDVPEDDVPENPDPPKKPGFMKRMMGKGEELQERKISKSQLYKIIKEEVEVILTNEETAEIFDLDISTLLDEMMNEEEKDTSFSDAAKDIEKKGTEGVFTAKAKKAGMGVQAYADKVLKKDSKASTKTKRQAGFAKGAATVARENK